MTADGGGRLRRRTPLLALLIAVAPASLSGQATTAVDLAILGAMPIEVQLLRSRLGDPVVRTIDGIEFTQGRLSGHSVVIVRVGVGKVNAAAAIPQ
jgi:adenosylhomocysteine nucleosidase